MNYSIAGKSGDFSLENRIYNIALFISLLLNIFVLSVNIISGFPLFFNITIAATIILCSFLYYISRFRNISGRFKHFLVIISLYDLVLSWFYNDGINGSTPIMAFYMVIVFLFVYRKANYALLVSVFVFTCLALVGLEFLHPQIVHPYQSEEARLLDIIIALAVILSVSGYILILFKKNYDHERTTIQQQKEKIEKQNVSIKNQNEEILTQRDEILAQRDEITAQRDMAEEQRDIIAMQNNEITSSIHYARSIQEALLPQPSMLGNWFTDSFVYYVPRDIVSGDFYWIKEQEAGLFFAVGDCTGHGVPGAFMSIMSISILNEIISDKSLSSPAVVLSMLRRMIIENLQQQAGNSGNKNTSIINDGLDISLCFFNKATNSLLYSGANNAIYLIRENSHAEPKVENLRIVKKHNFSLYEMKPDKMPVGIHPRMHEFSITEIQLYKNDQIVLFSDGFADQFGGEKGKKLKSKYFKEFLLSINSLNLQDQKQRLDSMIHDWMNHGNTETASSFDQVDDICIMSIKL